MNFNLKKRFLKYLSQFLETPSSTRYHPVAVPDPQALKRILEPCDILLVEGNLRYSEIIKYVTQSTWSHCGIYVGADAIASNNQHSSDDDPPCIIEALISEGVVTSRLSTYFNLNARILRPIALENQDKKKIIDFCLKKIGSHYDIDNVFDLLKYYLPISRFFLRKKSGSAGVFGSGDPERVICSSLIAQAFDSVGYPILPDIEKIKHNIHTSKSNYTNPETEIMKKRHFSMYSPRDFDTSPYFKIVKPTIELGFNYKKVTWKKGE